MTKLEHALALAARGFKVFPIAPGQKAPPLVANWPARATSDPTTIANYWAAAPEANIGIHCEGMIVIDVDVKKGGDESLNALEAVYDLPATLTTRTVTGGRHLFFNHGGVVGNSVSQLGDGLDVRSAGGYVVAPGSELGGRLYAFESDVPVADAPDWLVAKLGMSTKRVQVPKMDIPDAPLDVCNRAAEWLRKQPPAVEGQGGDAHTFKIVAALRDTGVSAIQAFGLLQEDWNVRCAPPWDLDDLWAKVSNAYRYAQNAAGERVATVDDFPFVAQDEQATPSVKDKQQNSAMRLGELAASQAKGPGPLVKGILQRGSHAVAYGQPGEGKSFVALDLAYCVAAGRSWMGHKTHAGVVLYLAYEGRGGLVKRAQALRQKYGQDDVPLYVAGAAFNLRDKAGRAEIGELLRSLPAKPVLIVIDTFARALMGGDENSAQDVGAFNSGIAALIENSGATVLLIHHSGKNKAAGARGSSALLGALDTELEVDGGQIVATKQRDIDLGEPIGFALKPVVVSIDDDGEDVTSCVIESAAVQVVELGRIAGNAKRAFETLCDMAPNNAPVGELAWKDRCAGFLPARKAAFWDVKRQLEKKGYITIDAQGMIQRRMT